MTSTPTPQITPAQREALHALGIGDDVIEHFSPEEVPQIIRNMTPERVEKLLNGGNAADRPKPVLGFDLSDPKEVKAEPDPAPNEATPTTDRPEDEDPNRFKVASDFSDLPVEDLGEGITVDHVEVLAKPDSREVREFVETIVAQARAATEQLKDPGLLQVVLVHPADDKISGIYRYELDDKNLAERMIADAISASEAGHNVYIEGRTVRRGLSGKQRGGLNDTVAVFALVVDSDADKGKAWSPTVSTSLAVETSPGNTHFWLFLEKAVDADTGKALGDRLRAATNADSDTGNVCQPYRIAGTPNYPNKTKLERGRVITPTRSLGFDPETLWTPERFEQNFPAPAEPIGDGTSSEGGTGPADESSIPADTLRIIREGVEDDADRSYAFFNVVKALKEDGWTLTGTFTLLDRYPKGIASKYRGRLQREIERIWAKLGKGPGQGTPGVTDITVLSQAEFLADFVPPDYLVDGVLQRRFIYSLTAVTGHGKTALALLLAQAAGSADPNARFGPHAVEKGRVIYFVGENPDDVRCRVIGANSNTGNN